MVFILFLNEYGRVFFGSLNWKLYLWLLCGMMGIFFLIFFLFVDNSLYKYIMIFYIYKMFYCVVKLMEVDFNGCF